MAECAEALDAVIGTHAAWPDATEGQIILRIMHQCSVNSDIARGRARQHLAAILTIVAEIVERQWLRSRVDVGDSFVDLAIGQDRENGSKDLRISSVVPSTIVGARVCGRVFASPNFGPGSMTRAPLLRASSSSSLSLA
jgi:hypothetical protein